MYLVVFINIVRHSLRKNSMHDTTGVLEERLLSRTFDF